MKLLGKDIETGISLSTDSPTAAAFWLALHVPSKRTLWWRWPSLMTLLVSMMLTLSAIIALELVLERDLLFASECFVTSQPQTIATYEFTFERLQQWKANWQSYATAIQSNDTKTCSPQMVDPTKVPYLSSHRFYSTLREMTPLAPPVFTHDARHLCDAEGESEEAGWSYCLPITGRKDSPYCDGASRMDLLVPLANETRCFASAVHMLLVDVYDEFKDVHRRPVLLYGSMLGAVRDGAPIPFTEDADLGYHDMTHDTATELVERLREKGYHMFFDAIWRVCIAPNHPLALNLYDPSVGTLNGAQQAPYADLYMLRRENASHWYADCTRDERLIPTAKFEPYARVSLNGIAMDTLADPVDFLVPSYLNKRPIAAGAELSGMDTGSPLAHAKWATSGSIERMSSASMNSRASAIAIDVATHTASHDGTSGSDEELLKKQRRSSWSRWLSSAARVCTCASWFTASSVQGPGTPPPYRRARLLLGMMTFAACWLLLYRSYEGILEELSAESCSPRSVHLAAPPQSASSRSEQFYEVAQQLGNLQAPVFHGRHRRLCDEQAGRKREWEYCLPISGRMDLPFCELPDRVDVLSRQRASLCYGSVLHMLLVDVYEVFQERGVKPALLYGTMLGAFRNGSTIPFTEDADLGYQPDKSTLQDLRDALWMRGYHMFHYGIGRICIAPTHPLASLLYDPRKGITTEYSVPYVDLYMMIPIEGNQWRVQLTKDKRFIPHAKFEPYSQLQLNNVTYDTLADPVDFLVHEYGDDYMVPKRTLNWFWTIVSYVWPI